MNCSIKTYVQLSARVAQEKGTVVSAGVAITVTADER